MAQHLPTGYVLDPEDPRAPTVEQWQQMVPDQRARVVAMLPIDVPLELLPNEGDPHRKATRGALDALDGYFRRTGRKVYLSSSLGVFYPGERRFAPDLIAVTDVEPHDRSSWIVDYERKGLDLVLEVHVSGDRRKDALGNVERYARLGIPEYFYFDRARLRLSGWRLVTMDATRSYQRIVPQAGRFASAVLGLDLGLEDSRFRFFAGNAPLEDADELIARLGSMLDKVLAGREEVERDAEELARELETQRGLREAEQGLLEAERRLREAERRRREEVEQQLAELRAENERLKKSVS